MPADPIKFPENFVWGVSSSSYQIEGAWEADGKGASIWDLFVEREARIWRGQDGRVACDHYNRMKEDVACMRQMGLKAYRFSLSWPRIMPDGTGRVNEAGMAFYDALINELMANDIEPWVTLFHWDYPYELFLQGGWLNRNSPLWFAEYTKVVVDRFSDRVSHWITVNEPQCFIGLGHRDGTHAPGLKLSMRECLLAGHHSLLAHGRSVEVIREHGKLTPTVGWSPSGSVYRPATDSMDDINAARAATNAVYAGNVWNTRWWGDPVVFGHYPEEGLKVYGDAAPKTTASDFEIIQQPIDFYGCNLFQAPPVRMSAEGVPVAAELAPGEPMSLYEWTQDPDCLYWGPRFIHEMYKLPIVVTENGCSTLDRISVDGAVHDSNRIDFMVGNLLSLERAMRDGVDVRGYFHWSLLDNFEWQEGYKHRYGLIHVNYETQVRTLKDSAFCYQEVIDSNGGSLQKYVHSDDTPVPYVVKEALRYIESNISEMFNVKTIAGHLNCHPDFLSRRFKQYTGTSLSAHIRRIRVEHARNLLRNPNMLIGDAADLSGFSDRIHFSKVFRKEMGMTAGEFQKQFRVASEAPVHPAIEISKNPRLM
ncbi:MULTISPECIES: GH1 family beta-glucosidase [unclassified Lentimonas]|uniref:GH1 family beta-glucosidase n=1 Tax=unclassified Lentimonas TaxID=2630993 RepID=UPI001328D19D|nr:Beta-glucosidase (EC [Lentimonas sp. CC10]CAA6691961.1 Beta-glucosidase (EC [Lentimonas sp. CC19]CAA7070559.1 Beta-glucosidase (EC [Lentimonas sp. CC11]